MNRRLPEGQRVNDSKPGAGKKDTIVTDTAIRFTSVLFKAATPTRKPIIAISPRDGRLSEYKYHFGEAVKRQN